MTSGSPPALKITNRLLHEGSLVTGFDPIAQVEAERRFLALTRLIFELT